MNWKSCKLILVFAFLFALLLGCAIGRQNIIYPKVSYYSNRTDFSEYESIAVLPFADAPNAPGSGQIVQGLIIQQLAQSSFKVVERSHLHELIKEHKLAMVGITDQSQALELGKVLGVRAIVVGEVGQYGMQARQTQTTYFPSTNYYTGQTTYIPIPGKTWNESTVSVSMRVLDVETGLLIYSGSAYYAQPITNPPQEAAQYICGDIIAHWLAGPGAVGFADEIRGVAGVKCPVVTNIAKGSPAEESGLKVGDIIIKVNGESTDNISLLKYFYLIKGSPGEKLNLEIQRGSKRESLTMIRSARDHW